MIVNAGVSSLGICTPALRSGNGTAVGLALLVIAKSLWWIGARALLKKAGMKFSQSGAAIP